MATHTLLQPRTDPVDDALASLREAYTPGEMRFAPAVSPFRV